MPSHFEEALILEVKKYKVLYDMADRFYYDTNVKDNAWQEISERLDTEVAVVVAFFICWAPFHAQRLLAVYSNYDSGYATSPTFIYIYTALTHVSGVLYYFSTTVNPLLYNIMSHKFREAFKGTLAKLCGRGNKISTPCRNYSVLSKGPKGTNGIVRQDTLTDGRRLRLAKQPATISNSSLQDVDDTEYTGVELASYMGQLNTS